MGQGFASNKVKQMGNEKFKAKDFESAILYYSKVLQYDKANHLVQANRCLCYLKTEQYGFAYEDAVEVIKKRPDFVKAHYRLGLVYEKMNILYESYMAFKRGCELDGYKTGSMIDKMNEIK